MYHYNLLHNDSFHYKNNIIKLLGEGSGKWEALALSSPEVSIKYLISLFHILFSTHFGTTRTNT